MTEEEIKALLCQLTYDRETGDFYWKAGRHRFKRAGRITTFGYRQISTGGKTIHAHILVFYVENNRLPDGDVDHRDRNKLHNRYQNLREATRSNNCGNKLARCDNTLGLKGVYPVKGGKYRSQITKNGVKFELGRFSSAEDAKRAYDAKSVELFGVFTPSIFVIPSEVFQ